MLGPRHFDQQMPIFADGRQRRQIASRRPFGDLAPRIECRSVASAIERMVALCFQLAFLMRTIRGKGDQFIALPDDKEPQVAEAWIDAIGGIVAERAGVDQFFRWTAGVAVLWVGRRGGSGSQDQELAPVHTLNLMVSVIALHGTILILKHQAGDKAPMDVSSRGFADREDKGTPKPRLHSADRFHVYPKANIRNKTGSAMIFVIQRRLP
jgi:hypothetical protein